MRAVNLTVAILLRRKVFVLRSAEKLRSASQLPTGKAQAIQRRENMFGKSSLQIAHIVSSKLSGISSPACNLLFQNDFHLNSSFQAELTMANDIPK